MVDKKKLLPRKLPAPKVVKKKPAVKSEPTDESSRSIVQTHKVTLISNVKVKNLKVVNKAIKITSPKFKVKEVLDALPKLDNSEELTIDIIGVNSAIANAIRMTLLDEYPVKHLTFDVDETPGNFTTTDRFQLYDMIQNRLSCIPLDQSIPDDAVFELHKENHTERPIVVYAGDMKRIQAKGKEGGTEESEDDTESFAVDQTQESEDETAETVSGGSDIKYFDDMNRIIWLNGGKDIHINKIVVSTDYGYNDGTCSLISGVSYKCLDVVPFTPGDLTSKSSLECNPQDYQIRFRTNGTIKALDYLKLILNNIIDRLNKLSNQIQNLTDDIFGDVQKTRSANVTEYHIKGHTYSIGNVITKCVYELDPNIRLIKSTIEHPSIREIIISVGHPDPDKMMIDGIGRGISYFHSILKQL